MNLDGKLLAESILAKLAKDVALLQTKGITPRLAVILVGDNPASLAYIKQKQKAAQRIGAEIVFDHQPATIRPEYLSARIIQYNNDPAIHGLIIQRPIPKEVGDVNHILNTVAPKKDVDGFLPDSPFEVPVARAVWEIIRSTRQHPKHIVVIGRGETAGAPILRYLKKKHCTTSLIHSHTLHPKEILQRADVIISCVGKERVVTGDSVKPGAMLISVGIWRDPSGKLRGDYNEEEIADLASFYTPTPGGVGPVNVACLMQNLIKACTMEIGGTL